MHPNPAFRRVPQATSLEFARAQGFGQMMINGPDGLPLVAHVPFVLDAAGAVAGFHLVRSNPIARAVGQGVPARLVVQGPHSYVSPDWYDVPQQVPTWNYVAVHLSGEIRPCAPDALLAQLNQISAQFEARLAPKRPWTTTKMDPPVMQGMMRQILPFALHVAQVDGTWKLGQNKPDAARVAAAGQMAQNGIGSNVADLAAMMQSPPADQLD